MKKVFTLIAMMLLATASSFAQNDRFLVAGAHQIVLGDKDWDWSSTENFMTQVVFATATDPTEKWELRVENCQLEQGINYEYKVKDNGSDPAEWYPTGSNGVIAVQETGLYTVVIYAEDDGLGLTVDNEEPVKTGEWTPSDVRTLTVAGKPAALFGTEWDPTNNANNMTKRADGIYELVLTGKTLPAGVVEYKVTQDHGWGTAWPSSNASFRIEEDGTYDVTFTFDYDTKRPEATYEKTGTAIIEHYWTIAGSSIGTDVKDGLEDPVFGTTWAPKLEQNNMTQTDDENIWKLVLNDVQVGSEPLVFKACYDHAWDKAWGALADEQGKIANAMLTVNPGTYDITFTLDLTAGAEQVTASVPGGSTGINEVTEQAEKVYYNLQGIRTNKLQRGLYITNGRKVVIK